MRARASGATSNGAGSKEPVDQLAHVAAEPNPDAAELLGRAVQMSVGSRLTDGNSVQVLKNGNEIFPGMLAAIEGAERTIDFLTFVYWKGEIARRFAKVLADKARDGIRVRVVLDDFGSKPMDDALVKEMEGAGVLVERFRPMATWKFWEADKRTHRKILVVDDRIGFTGGVGIAEEWEGDARGPHEWRDTHFRVEGPSVLGLKAVFLADWRDTDHPVERADIDVETPQISGDVTMGIVDGSVQVGVDHAERLLEGVTAAARQRILVQTPYFNPTQDLLDLLKEAIYRGVSVDILLPGPHIDKRVSKIMAEEMYDRLVEAGARVWIYQPTMMHVKAYLVDGILSVVGSINVNRRSFGKDEEVAAAILDREITRTLESHFVEDVARSVPVGSTEARGILKRLTAKALKPLRAEM